MQHRYTGDIGDFGKFGLIRFLLNNNSKPLRLGVIWFLTHPQAKEVLRNDGKHTSYLTGKGDERLIQCDRDLYHKLQQVVTKQRHLSEIHAQDILPGDTIYYDEPVEKPDLPPAYRSLYRNAYLAQAALAMRGTDLVFCDPDNGLGNLKSDTKTKGAGKSVFLDELKLLWGFGHSLLIYNHRTRESEDVIRARYRQLKKHLGAKQITVFRFRKGSQRDFIFIPQSRHSNHFSNRVGVFESSPWVKQGAFQTFTL